MRFLLLEQSLSGIKISSGVCETEHGLRGISDGPWLVMYTKSLLLGVPYFAWWSGTRITGLLLNPPTLKVLVELIVQLWLLLVELLVSRAPLGQPLFFVSNPHASSRQK